MIAAKNYKDCGLAESKDLAPKKAILSTRSRNSLFPTIDGHWLFMAPILGS